jgi:hypothetical protein
MADLSLEWGDDLVLAPAGDLSLIDGPEETRQRLERRLLQAARAYVFHPLYGLGLPQRIGKVARAAVLRTLVRTQIAYESTVARLPRPRVNVTYVASNPGLYVIDIKYTDRVTGAAQAITLEVPGGST